MPDQKNKPTDTSSTKPLDIVSSVDYALRIAGRGGRSTINSELTHGFDLTGNGQMTPKSHTNNGMVFFTRPMLNLTYDNLSEARELYIYRDAPELSWPRAARVYLDPISQISNVVKMADGRTFSPHNQIDTRLVDPLNPFICTLTNNLISLSGWPDMRLDTYVREKGLRNDQWMMADGIADVNDGFSLNANFTNNEGGNIYHLFYLWVKYMSNIRYNMHPYPMMIAKRRIDYQTRIYNFNLDSTKRYIVDWATTGVSQPTNVPAGAIHDYDREKQVKDQLDAISIEFQCLGAMYNDLTSLYEFNKLVGWFNPDLRTYEVGQSHRNSLTDFEASYTSDFEDLVPIGNRGGTKRYIKLREHEKLLGNYHAYPLVNLVTKELEWWMKAEDYRQYVHAPLLAEAQAWGQVEQTRDLNEALKKKESTR